MLRETFLTGVRLVRRHIWLILPLYLMGLVPGLVQAWPLVAAGRGALTNPFIGELSNGGQAAILDLLIGGGAGVQQLIGAWILLVPLLLGGFSLAYNFFSGGILNTYLGGQRSFWAACWHWFGSFIGLGALLILLVMLTSVVAALLGALLGPVVGVIVAVLLWQVVGVLGEYARALAVAGERRNPLVLLGRAARFCWQHMGVVALLALLALLALALLTAVYNVLSGALGAAALAVVVQQLAALLAVTLKLLRLAWAAALVAPQRPAPAA